MTRDPDRRLDLRLVAADRPVDPQVLDDLVRLIRQGLATAPTQVDRVGGAAGFRPPAEDERKATADVEGRVKHRIEQDPDSYGSLPKRAELTSRPDHEQALADAQRRAAEAVVSAVQRALFRGVEPRVPDPDKPTDAAG